VLIGPITRAKAKKLKEVSNGLVQNIWSKMDLEELRTSKEHNHKAQVVKTLHESVR
jgi:hypothetical protein